MSTRSTASSTTTGSSSERARLVIMSSSLLHLILKTLSGIFLPAYFVYICFHCFVTVINCHKYTTVNYKPVKSILALRYFCFICYIYFLDNVLSG